MTHVIILYVALGALAGFFGTQLYLHHRVLRLQDSINRDFLLVLGRLADFCEKQNGGPL